MPETIVMDEPIDSKIGLLKYNLEQTDYVIVKLMEADTEEERTQLRQKYADIISQRKQWRVQINKLEEHPLDDVPTSAPSNNEG